MNLSVIENKIRNIPDFPKKGIQFKDITPILKDPLCFDFIIDCFFNEYKNKKINSIVGIESRGFIFGAPLAIKMKIPFVLARKPGKLPYKTISQEYDLEYGKDSLEIHEDSINQNDKVLIIDDLIATGGTVLACKKLIKKLSNKEPEFGFFIDLGIVEKSFPNSYSIIKFNIK